MDLLQKFTNIASVYYNRSSWHELIKFINPLLQEAHKNGALLTYYVNFGLHGGDHIKLTLHQNDNKFEKKIAGLVVQFLVRNPSETKSVQYPLNTFFMNHANNSIWFSQNNDSIFLHSIQHKGLEDMRWQISRALLDALGSEEIDLEIIYTFLSYMQIGIIKAAYPDIKLAYANAAVLICYLDVLRDIDEIEIERKDEKENQYFKQLFGENQAILREIVKEIWEPSGGDSDLKWMGSWEAACQNFLIGSDFKSSFVLLSRLICEHVGFMHTGNLLQLSSKLISASFLTGIN